MAKEHDPSGHRDYSISLDYLYGLQKFGMVFGLAQVRSILETVGKPDEELQAIHIAGTNGKGSTAAMMASMLQREGYRVGLYTSPHLVRFTERIQVNGIEISEEEVAELTRWMKERIEASKITSGFTFFDFTTAMAFLYFVQKRVDLGILEVGLGGRLDSTNVITPLLSVITNVAKDHEEILGRSLLKIAGEKAGIIKPGRPLITAATQPRVLHLFSKACERDDVPFYRVGKDFRYERVGERNFHYEGIHRKIWSIRLNLAGQHQVVNAATALGAMEVLEDLGYPVSTEAMIRGLADVRWPGRFEVVRSSPRVVLDGAHNPAGAIALREALRKELRYRRLILLFGIMKDKDMRTILRTLAPLADHIILSRPRTDRASSPELLLRLLGKDRKKAEAVEDLGLAIDKGLSLTDREDLLCITGSLYTVGEARKYLLDGDGS